MPLRNGAVFAGFTIIRLLGIGGMGEVYLAKHPRLNRNDALKILPAHVSSDSEYRRRFDREADLAASLWHPHVVGVHDRGEFNGQLWISMDFVDGTDAATLLKQRYPSGMPRDEVLEVIDAIGDALDSAHQRGLLHRDVKPANILITRPEHGRRRVLLADFGIARSVNDEVSRLTATNMTLGTVSYAAPEQLSGDTIDGRADQYALAATGFHLLTGAPPFDHSNPAVIIAGHLNTPPPRIGGARPDLVGLDFALSRALAKSPADRFATCGEFATALRHSMPRPIGGATQTAVAPTPLRASMAIPPQSARPIRKLVLIVFAAAAAVLAAAVVIGMQLAKSGSGSTSADAPSSSLVRLTPSLPTPAGGETTGNRPPLTSTMPAPEVMLLPDADGEGFTTYGGAARCNTGDRAEMVLRTDYSAVVVCQTSSGSAYYRGLRLSDMGTIQLASVYRDGPALVAVNPADGTRYEVSHSGLRIVQGGQVLATEPAVEAAP